MKPATAEKLLTVLFRLNAIILMSAALAILLPDRWMDSIHHWLGLGTYPDATITEYLARSCSLLYAIHGSVLFYVSIDMRRHWNMVRFLAVLHMVLGAVILAIDIKSGMPGFWTMGEGPGIFLFGSFLCWLWKRASTPADHQSSHAE